MAINKTNVIKHVMPAPQHASEFSRQIKDGKRPSFLDGSKTDFASSLVPLLNAGQTLKRDICCKGLSLPEVVPARTIPARGYHDTICVTVDLPNVT